MPSKPNLATKSANHKNAKQIAIVYKSKYGTTKKYAIRLAKAIASHKTCDIYEADKIPAKALNHYDIVIFAGAIYSGVLNLAQNLQDFLAQAKQAKKQHTKQSQKAQKHTRQHITPKIHCLIIGLSNPNNAQNYQNALDNNLTKTQQQGIRFHFLQGGLDFNKLDKSDKQAMQAYRAMLAKRDSLSKEQEALLANKAVDFTNKDSLKPVINAIKDALTLC